MNAATANRSYFKEAYRTGVHGWAAEPSPYVLRFLNRLKKGRLLDLGCGEGRHAIAAARLGFQVTAVDSEPLALRRARRAARGFAVRFLKADALRLPFPEGSFDAIIDYGCLHHQKKSDWPRYLGQILRLLAPRGRYILEAFSPRFRFFRGRGRPWHIAFGAYRRCFTRADLEALFGPHFDFLFLKEEKERGFWQAFLRRKTQIPADPKPGRG
ncbi:MAG: methyltransferase domain-containing protein [Elusimicrobia bacterium]|nr:methyltransferase domain-containing protein [Elusimicrobiota bacterium]